MRVPEYAETLPDGRARCKVCGDVLRSVSGVQLHHGKRHRTPANAHRHRWRVLRSTGRDAAMVARGAAVVCVTCGKAG